MKDNYMFIFNGGVDQQWPLSRADQTWPMATRPGSHQRNGDTWRSFMKVLIPAPGGGARNREWVHGHPLGR